PWRTVRREYRMDSCGAGRWRGGPGMEWEAVNEGEECGMHTGAGHGETTFGPGAMGGQSTPPNECYILRGEQLFPARCHKLHQILPRDHVIRKTGGGAGVGRPEERDPQKVWEDVFIHNLVSMEAAREVYTVAIDPQSRKIDREKTRALRGA
ncbi:MAG: hydantoinase B/oxoprolinase family protein, partial [Deltaproteobacteria bacterium]|nr:hydantoinase B/oxoprolinase family protein [Deltaproteobacteria bacterium]